jgi:CheY-like chemotaxis protein
LRAKGAVSDMANRAASMPSPVAPLAAPGRPVPVDITSSTAARQLTLLVVDDDPAIRDLASGLLGDAGYSVITAGDGVEALHVISEARPDLVITDLRMPHMSGFELLKILRERFPQLPVIAVSGEFTGDALPAGVIADVFFSKDCYTSLRFAAAIEELLAIAPMRTGVAAKHADMIYGDADIRAVLERLAHEMPLASQDLGQATSAGAGPRTRPSAFATSQE